MEKENQKLELALQEADTEKATLLKTIAELRSSGGQTQAPMGTTGAMPRLWEINVLKFRNIQFF